MTAVDLGFSFPSEGSPLRQSALISHSCLNIQPHPNRRHRLPSREADNPVCDVEVIEELQRRCEDRDETSNFDGKCCPQMFDEGGELSCRE